MKPCRGWDRACGVLTPRSLCFFCTKSKLLNRCGVVMPYAKEPCARQRGHGTEHRSAYAMENARHHKRMGYAA